MGDLARPCAVRVGVGVSRKLAARAKAGDLRAIHLLAALRSFADVPFSEVRFDSLARSLAAYEAPISTLLGGPYTGGPTP